MLYPSALVVNRHKLCKSVLLTPCVSPLGGVKSSVGDKRGLLKRTVHGGSSVPDSTSGRRRLLKMDLLEF
ncbi:hypothetical protein AVEN_265821-1 [Araneus ventricosus]|uniref:Uncharacterized protein n=1 Tax=Araneus ventricosus TaxID=182803 RepID=A0A4Y2DYT8_ARAVE|nr:hypothetical protein AVEN_265821-1 [Araneus ventricosus]